MSDGIMHLLDPAPFGRVLPAMITPMKPNGDVDFDMAQTVAKQLVADGADGLVVNGTTGESPTVFYPQKLELFRAVDEKVELVKAVKEVVDVPVISGAGSNDTAHTVRMVEQTQEAGADAVLVVCPYYSRPSQQGIFCHYQAVNESADKPIIVYDVPGRTGVRIALDTYVHLAELDHVKAVKDATGDIAGAVRKRMETGLTWYSVVAHAAAKPMRELAEAFDRGDIAKAQGLANRIAPVIEAMNGTGFQAVMAKAALKVRGIMECTTMRLPNIGPNDEQIEVVRDGLRASGLIPE